jgi:hypothetical protein
VHFNQEPRQKIKITIDFIAIFVIWRCLECVLRERNVLFHQCARHKIKITIDFIAIFVIWRCLECVLCERNVLFHQLVFKKEKKEKKGKKTYPVLNLEVFIFLKFFRLKNYIQPE